MGIVAHTKHIMVHDQSVQTKPNGVCTNYNIQQTVRTHFKEIVYTLLGKIVLR